MKADTLDEEIFNEEIDDKSVKEDKEDMLNNVVKKKVKKHKKKDNLFLNKKRNNILLKYPLRKIIDFITADRTNLCKVFNLISTEILNLNNLFEKKLFIPDTKSKINGTINNLIEFNQDSLKESINAKDFYQGKIKPFLILYGSNCYDLIKYEKLLKNEQRSTFNLVILNFFGKHKKIEEEIAKIKDKFNKSKNTPNTIFIILTTPNRILKLSNKNLLDYSYTAYNILDLTPNVKNLTFLDMKDCRVDFFNFINLFLTTSCFNKTKFIININNKEILN